MSDDLPALRSPAEIIDEFIDDEDRIYTPGDILMTLLGEGWILVNRDGLPIHDGEQTTLEGTVTLFHPRHD